MKKTMVFICFGLTAILIAAAYFVPSSFWQAVAINTGTCFLTLGVGLILVNIYLERNARRGAVRSLLLLSSRTIIEYHNELMDLCWARFGRDDWGKIGQEYLNSNGQPEAVKQEVRDFLYDLAKNNRSLMSKLERLDESLTELSRMVGWDLDPRLLESCLDSRIAIGRLKDIDLDDSAKAKDLATKYIMDSDIHSQRSRNILMSIAGISE